MNIYKYRKRGTTYYYFKCQINKVQYCRRGYKSRQFANLAYMAFISSINGKGDDMKLHGALIGFSDYYKEKIKASSFYNFRKRRDKYLMQLPDLPVSSIGFKEFYTWFSSLDVSDAVKSRLLYDLKNFFDWCEIYLKVRNDEYKKLFVAKTDAIEVKKEKIVLSTKDFLIFYHGLDCEYWKLFFLIQFLFALRVSECRGLFVYDIEFNNGTLLVDHQVNNSLGVGKSKVTSTKTGVVKSFYLPDFLLLRLKEYCTGKNKNSFLFDGRSGCVGVTTINRKIKEVCKKTGLPLFSSHAFRRSEASILNDTGLNGEVIKDYLGHSSFNTTKKYYLGDSEEKKEKIKDIMQDKFSKVFSE